MHFSLVEVVRSPVLKLFRVARLRFRALGRLDPPEPKQRIALDRPIRTRHPRGNSKLDRAQSSELDLHFLTPKPHQLRDK